MKARIITSLLAFCAVTRLTANEAVKAAFLQVAKEQAEAADTAGDAEAAGLLRSGILAAQPQSAEILASPSPDTSHITAVRLPRVIEGNPYRDALARGAAFSLGQADPPWPKNTPEVNVFANPSGTAATARDTAAQMEAYLWLFANPASPLRHHPGVLARFLRRALAYADAIDVHRGTKAGQIIFDDFAIAPAVSALREFSRLYPGLLLPSQRALIDRAMRVAGDKILAHSLEHREKHGRGYANIDLSIAYELQNIGLYLKDAAMLDRSRELFHGLAAAVLPDGGTHYIWSQNESPGYHNVVAQLLARSYEIEEDPRLLELLKALEWYGPVSIGRMGEFWTAPAWKQQWNVPLEGIVGGEFVVAATGNPYLRGMLKMPELNERDARKWPAARPSVAWYRNDIRPRDLPDDLTYLDRNIAGPRAWYGRFSYAATLRDLPVDEPGHATLMGALTTTENFQMQAFVMAVGPRLFLGGKPEDPRAWAGLTSGLVSGLILTRHASVVIAGYDLSQFNSSSTGRVVPWKGRQLWLGMKDRIVGLIQALPNESGTDSAGLEGLVRLGTGGTVNGSPQSLQNLAGGGYCYGDLIIRPVAHNFSEIATALVPFRLPDRPVTEIRWRETEGGRGLRWFLVEIRPTWADAAEIDVRDPATDMPCLAVGAGGRRMVVVGNFGAKAADVRFPGSSVRSSLFCSDASPSAPGPENVTLNPGKAALLVESPDATDHLPGGKTFREQVAVSEPEGHQ